MQVKPGHTSEGTAPATKAGSRQLPAIQVLRAIAASIVVMHHWSIIAGVYTTAPSWIASSHTGQWGASGVDLFFVISGFIMVWTSTRSTGPGDALEFLRRRAVRIYPLYWVWTTVLLVLWKANFAFSSLHFSKGFLAGSYLLYPVRSSLGWHPLLDQGWTLSFELLFYVIFAATIAFGVRRFRILYLAAGFAIAAAAAHFLSSDNGLHYLLSNPLIVEFLYGVVAAEIALALHKRGTHASKMRLPAVILLSLGAILMVATIFVPYAEDLRWIFWGIPSFLLVLGAAFLGQRPIHSFLLFLGDASYSIYLTHAFVLLIYRVLMKRHVPLPTNSPDITIVVGTIITVLLTSLSYPFVEKQILHHLAFLTKSRTKRA